MNNTIALKLKYFDYSRILTGLILLINVFFFGIIVFSFFISAVPQNVVSVLENGGFDAVKVTLVSVAVSSVFNVVLGVPAAFLIARKKSVIFKIIDLITVIPIVIPPSVAGLALLVTFGRRGFFAEIFSFLELNIAFSFAAIVMAQIFVTLPIFIQIMKNGFKSVEKEIEEAAMLEGAREKELLLQIYLPLTTKYLATGIILSILRAAGEFGATIMFAGNLAGKTRTLTTAIYTLTEYNITEAVSLALVLILLFMVPLLLLKLSIKEQ